MFDFSHLDPAARTAKFPMPWLGADAHLELACANDSANPSLAMATSELLDRRDGDVLDALTGKNRLMSADELRDASRRLYPEHVVRGWRGVCDTSGKPVEFTVDACRELFAKLPAWILDRIRLFALRPENFVGMGRGMTPSQVDRLAGNSSAG